MIKYARYLFVFFCFLVTIPLIGQTVRNVRADFDGERVQITYDLDHPDASQKFRISLFSSHDDFARPLTLLTGDAGEQVSPGTDRKVIWFAKNVLPSDFDREITIKVRASQAFAKLSLKPLTSTIHRRGRMLELEWIGGRPTDRVNIELLRDGQVRTRVAEKIVNIHRYQWSIPRKLRAGQGYSLRISNPDNSAESATTQAFVVKPRVPLLAKLSPVPVAVVVVYLLFGDRPLEDLPGPVDPQ